MAWRSISHDQGATWTNEVHLEDPKGLAYSRHNQPGYPDFADLPNGQTLVIFHSVKVVGQPQLRGKPGEDDVRKRVLYIAYNALQPQP